MSVHVSSAQLDFDRIGTHWLENWLVASSESWSGADSGSELDTELVSR